LNMPFLLDVFQGGCSRCGGRGDRANHQGCANSNPSGLDHFLISECPLMKFNGGNTGKVRASLPLWLIFYIFQ
jgi:hypothetical protein